MAQSPCLRMNYFGRPPRITRKEAPRLLRNGLLSSPPGKNICQVRAGHIGHFARAPCPTIIVRAVGAIGHQPACKAQARRPGPGAECREVHKSHGTRGCARRAVPRDLWRVFPQAMYSFLRTSYYGLHRPPSETTGGFEGARVARSQLRSSGIRSPGRPSLGDFPSRWCG